MEEEKDAEVGGGEEVPTPHQHGRRGVWWRLGLAVGLTVAFALAMGALTANKWTKIRYYYYLPWYEWHDEWWYGTKKEGGSLTVGLWRVGSVHVPQTVDPDSDFGEFRAAEKARDLNRASSIIDVVVTFGAAVYYYVTACCFRSKRAEFVLAAGLFVTSVLAWGAFGAWYDAFHRKYPLEGRHDPGIDKGRRTCQAGCVLKACSASLQVGLALAALAVAVKTGENTGWIRAVDGGDDVDCCSCTCRCGCCVHRQATQPIPKDDGGNLVKAQPTDAETSGVDDDVAAGIPGTQKDASGTAPLETEFP